jgi:hypothetical protein
MPSARYQLSSNVYACLVSEQFVFLDLHEDKYTCLDVPTSSLACPTLQKLIEGSACPEPDSCLDHESILAELTKANILVASEETSPRERLVVPPVDGALTPKFTAGRAFTAHHAFNFSISVITASSRLRLFSLQSTVARERARTHGATHRNFDQARARDLLTAFAALRVFWSTPRQCLFDALALRVFLARYGLHAHWVFGVRMNPFGAHCWVQHESIVLNDSVEFVRAFTPIMTV